MSNLIKISIQSIWGTEEKTLCRFRGQWEKYTKKGTHLWVKKIYAWYQRGVSFVWWWEHGVLSVTHGKSGGVSFCPSFKLDVSPCLRTQQTAEVTQMRFFLLRSATWSDETRRFPLPSSLSQTDARKSGPTPTCKHIWTWQPLPTIPQDSILPFFPKDVEVPQVKTNQSN